MTHLCNQNALRKTCPHATLKRLRKKRREKNFAFLLHPANLKVKRFTYIHTYIHECQAVFALTSPDFLLIVTCTGILSPTVKECVGAVRDVNLVADALGMYLSGAGTNMALVSSSRDKPVHVRMCVYMYICVCTCIYLARVPTWLW